MNKKLQPGELLTVFGRTADCHIGKALDAAGYEWITLAHSTTGGAHSAPVYVHPESIPEICAALESACGLRRSAQRDCEIRKERRASEFLRARRAGESWNPGEEALLMHLYLEGYGIKEIAIHLGRSYGAITSRLRQMGIADSLEF